MSHGRLERRAYPSQARRGPVHTLGQMGGISSVRISPRAILIAGARCPIVPFSLLHIVPCRTCHNNCLDRSDLSSQICIRSLDPN